MKLAADLGFQTKIRPQRGELLITEKPGDRLPFLSSTIRQVNEGGVQIGGAKAAGMDDSATLDVMAGLARHAAQVYRSIGVNRSLRNWLGKDYAAGERFVDAFDHTHITTQFGARVWRLETGPRVLWSRNGASNISIAPHVLLAGGAQERPVPFPGWTLPGVMTAGPAQILMKTSGILPKEAVLAGSGPLLFLIAAHDV
jgi:hypothetical protein